MSQCELMPMSMPSPSVMLHNGRPATTSLEVAKFFDKRHDNVVRDIRSIIDNCPERFTALNFEVSNYLDNTGRSLPLFIIFKDGFTLLVMGYTGPEAMRFKLAYIEAFNALEAEVHRQREGALPPAPRKFSPSSTLSRKPLEKLVKVWASQSGLPYAQCWTMLNAHFGLEKITELPEEWIPDAVAWVEEQLRPTPPALPGTAPLPLSETEKALCALRVEELERLEDEWLGFAAETRAKFGRLEREYQRTAGASFSVLLNRFPTESLVPTDAVTALLSLTVRDARTALESGLTGLHHAISASRIVNKLLARGAA